MPNFGVFLLFLLLASSDLPAFVMRILWPLRFGGQLSDLPRILLAICVAATEEWFWACAAGLPLLRLYSDLGPTLTNSQNL